MSNKGTKTRITNAFRAMKGIGISEDKVKPVLKNLLKLYDKNWELIEAENYSALADAIFEKEEAVADEPPEKIVNSEAAEHSKNHVNNENEDDMQEEAEASEELERPFKRIRHKDRDNQTSSLSMPNTGVVKTALVMPNEELDIAENIRVKTQVLVCQSLGNIRGKQPISPMSLVVHERSDPCQPSGISNSLQNVPLRIESRPCSLMKLRDRGKGSVSPEIPFKGRRQVLEGSSHALTLREPIIEPGVDWSPQQKIPATDALIKPKDEPVFDDIPLLEAPIAVIHPDPSNGGDSSSRDGTIRGNVSEPSLCQSVCESETADGTASRNEPRSNGKLAIAYDERSSDLEIASSPSGEVKIFLSCNLALGRPDFKMPNLEAVLKSVEDKYLRPYQTLDPKLSVVNLMKDMCQCFLQLGTKDDSELPGTTDVTPGADLQSKSSGTNALGTRDLCYRPLKGSVDTLSNAEVPFSTTPLCPHSEGVDDGSLTEQVAVGVVSGTDGGEQENFVEQNSLSLMVTQQPQLTPEMIRSVHDVVDIAKGQEKVLILLVNQVDDQYPPSFFYIPHNAVFNSAHVDLSLARIGDNNCCSTCFGDCLTLPTACACGHENGGFAYTTDGLVKDELLKECISLKRDSKKHYQTFCKECPLERSKGHDVIEPCKGHLARKFIKECWLKCGCDKQCGNRVVQRGISRNLQVFMTPEGKGWGLRTLDDLPKGAFVCEYVGEVLSTAELFDRVLLSQKGEKYPYPVFLDADWCAEELLKDEDALCLDARYYGNVARFINHRCLDSNLVDIPVEVETPDHHYYHVAFFTTREVKAMEELTWDYGIDFNDHDHPVKTFQCRCGSKFCRSIKRYRSRTARI